MGEQIVVTGIIEVAPADHEAAAAAFRRALIPTRAEDGCEHYSFAADLEQPGRFHLTEQWRAQACIDAHIAAPHMAELFGTLGALGITSTSLTRWAGATPERLI
jgi:quinol monooxygenase YgiN